MWGFPYISPSATYISNEKKIYFCAPFISISYSIYHVKMMSTLLNVLVKNLMDCRNGWKGFESLNLKSKILKKQRQDKAKIRQSYLCSCNYKDTAFLYIYIYTLQISPQYIFAKDMWHACGWLSLRVVVSAVVPTCNCL